MEIEEKSYSLFKTIDEMDADKFVTYLTEDARFRFGNVPVVVGKQAIRNAVDGFYKSIKSLRHECENLWVNGRPCYLQRESDLYQAGWKYSPGAIRQCLWNER